MTGYVIGSKPKCPLFSHSLVCSKNNSYFLIIKPLLNKYSFGNKLVNFKDIQVQGPPRGYFLEPTKSILVVAPRNVARVEEYFRGMGMTVVTRIRYLGRFIGDWDAYTMWFDEKVQGWADLIKKLSEVGRKHP